MKPRKPILRKTPLKRSTKPIARKSPIKKKSESTAQGEIVFKYKITGIAPVSKSRKEALKRYNRLRDKYFEENPVCEYPGCESTEVTLHHQKGRIGAFLTDKRFFKSLCWPHHKWVEENPAEAQKMGLSKKRLDKFE